MLTTLLALSLDHMLLASAGTGKLGVVITAWPQVFIAEYLAANEAQEYLRAGVTPSALCIAAMHHRHCSLEAYLILCSMAPWRAFRPCPAPENEGILGSTTLGMYLGERELVLMVLDSVAVPQSITAAGSVVLSSA